MANLSNINGKFVVEQTTGYVGVGTTDPNYPIEVLNASAEIALNSSGGSIYRLKSDSTDAFRINKNGVGDRLIISSGGDATFSGSITANTGSKITSSSADTKFSIETTSGTTIFPILDFVSSHSSAGARIRVNSVDVISLDKSQNATVAGNMTINGGQILTPGGVNIALNPNTGTVSVGGIIQCTGAGVSTFAGSISASGGTMTADTTFNSNIILEGNIFHKDDTNTYFGFNSGSSTDDTIVFATSNVQRLTINSSGNSTFSGDIIGNSAGTTEIGAYPTGGIKRIMMGSGGEIHFGDTTTSSALGLTEGAWDQFGDTDRLGLYCRNELKVYGNSNVLRLTIPTNGDAAFASGATFAGIVTFNPDSDSTFSIADAGTNAVYMRAGADDEVYFGANNNYQLRLKTNKDVVMDNGGNLGIGTTSPEEKLHVRQDAAGGVNNFILELQNTTTVADSRAGILFSMNSSVGSARDGFAIQGSNNGIDGQGNLLFGSVVNNTFTERMRITSGGDILIGSGGAIFVPDSLKIDGNGLVSSSKLGTGTTTHYNFLNNNGVVGSIKTSGSTTSYNTNSDYRLKEDLKDFAGLDMVSKIPVYDFKWKTDESRSYGVMAHELQEVLPQAVSGDKDAEEMQGVDYSKIVPLLVKSIQEQQKQIKELQDKSCKCNCK